MSADLGGLLAVVSKLGQDERAVLQLVAERLAMGQSVYGQFNVHGDRRRFGQEALEEAADGLVYAACALMRGAR